MSISGYYSQESLLSSSSKEQKRYKPLKDWSVIQDLGNKYSGINVPARKHAVAIVGYASETNLFAFNVTYNRQAQEAFQEVSERIKDLIKNSVSVKLWKILPYKKIYEGSSGVIDNWIAANFPNVSVEKIELKKNDSFLIDRESGHVTTECNPEPLYKETVRRLNKLYLILSCNENKLAFSSLKCTE